MNEEIDKGLATESLPPKDSKLPRYIGITVIIAVILGLAYFFVNKSSSIVAVVNGQKITLAQYNEHYARINANVLAQGISATSTEMMETIKNQTLDDLISEILLLQSAEKEGIVADEVNINMQITQSKSQFPDNAAFVKALTDKGFTDRSYKETIIRANIISQYLETHISASSTIATAEDIKVLYDRVAATNPTLPPLEQVRSQVEEQIILEKRQQLVSEHIKSLRDASTIEILI